MNLGDLVYYNYKKYRIIEFQSKSDKYFGDYTMVVMQDVEDKEKYIWVNKDLLLEYGQFL